MTGTITAQRENVDWSIYKWTVEEIYLVGDNLDFPFSIEDRLQRDERIDRINHICDRFNPNALGVATISERNDGSRILLDGQHRYKGGRKRGFRGPYLTRVVRGLTLEEEGRLFRDLNDTAKVPVLQAFKVAVQAEHDPKATKLNRMLEDYGLVPQQGRADSFSAVATALRLLDGKDGDARLRWALDIATSAWPNPLYGPERVHSTIVEALTLFKGRYGDAIDRDLLIRRLRQEGGPDIILGNAKTLKQAHKGSIKVAAARAITNLYNLNMRRHKLADWEQTKFQYQVDVERSRAK